jgi:two-component system LytT family response regulator
MPDIRVLIVDDEPLARRGIRQLLETHDGFVVAGEARNGREALRSLESLSPDLVFLDIQMPGLDGFGVLRSFGVERMPAVVFVTAFDEFAVRAFEAQALDYLVKPVSESRFSTTLARVRERLRVADALALARRLTALLGLEMPAAEGRRGHAGAPRIAVPADSGELLLDPGEIDWIEAEDYYAGIHSSGRRYRVREPLASLEARLDRARFVRVHRSAIVALDQIRELRPAPAGGGSEVVLRDGTRLPVSRRRQTELRELLRESTGRPTS